MPCSAHRDPVHSVARAAGLARPARGWASWVCDRHVIAALAAAVPVWVALGLALGHRMQVHAGWALVSFVLLQPVAEELVFRGVLHGAFLRRTAARGMGPFTLANLGTTAVFVALHLPAQPTGWALAVAVPSLVFGHLRDRLGSVLPPACLHVVYNAGFALTAWSVQH